MCASFERAVDPVQALQSVETGGRDRGLSPSPSRLSLEAGHEYVGYLAVLINQPRVLALRLAESAVHHAGDGTRQGAFFARSAHLDYRQYSYEGLVHTIRRAASVMRAAHDRPGARVPRAGNATATAPRAPRPLSSN